MKRFWQILLLIIYTLTFIIPGYTFYITNKTSMDTLFASSQTTVMLILFRLLGLYAFTFIWSQIMLGAFRIPLTRLYGPRILQLHITLGIFTLLFATLHPFLFYLGSWMLGTLPWQALMAYLGDALYIYGLFGVAAWTLMMATVLTALLRKKAFMTNHWRKIHYANYLIFVLVFVHSFKIGSDVAARPLDLLYLFFGITFIAGLLYKRGLPIVKNFTTTPTTTATK